MRSFFPHQVFGGGAGTKHSLYAGDKQGTSDNDDYVTWQGTTGCTDTATTYKPLCCGTNQGNVARWDCKVWHENAKCSTRGG